MGSDNLDGWIGRTRTTRDTVGPVQVRQLAATLNEDAHVDNPGSGDLPPGWHWLFFNPLAAQSLLSPDGHPPRGDFLPPVDLPRRMWAGTRLHWRRAFAIGSTVAKTSTILDVKHKSGRSGELVFVTVGHRYADDRGTLLDEEHDIVYRGAATEQDKAALSDSAAQVRDGAHAFEREGEHVRRVDADATLLFRYSAVTFNGHRIHYDADYARDVESYPGLVVHGPLIATMLLDLVRHDVAAGRFIDRFDFRMLRPTFDISPFHLHATLSETGAEVWSTDNLGRVALSGHASWHR